MRTKCHVCGEDLEYQEADCGNPFTCPTCKRVGEYPRRETPKPPALKPVASKLMLCPSGCGRPIAPDAWSCPNCGYRVLSNYDLASKLTLFVLLSLIVIVISAGIILAGLAAVLGIFGRFSK